MACVNVRFPRKNLETQNVGDLYQEEQERLQGELLVKALFKVQIY